MANDGGFFDINDYIGRQPNPAIPSLPERLPLPTPSAAVMSAYNSSAGASRTAAPTGGAGEAGFIPSEVARYEAQNGGMRLDDTQLEEIRERFKAQELPHMATPKMQQWEYEGMANSFDSAFEDYKKGYLGQGTPTAPIADDKHWWQYVTDPAVAVGTGLGKVVGGVAGLVDMVQRNVSAELAQTRGYVPLLKTVIDNGLLDDKTLQAARDMRTMGNVARGEKTTIGQFGADWNKGVDELHDAAVSNAMLKSRAEVEEAWTDPSKSFASKLITAVAHPAYIIDEAGQMSGSFIPGAGLVKLKSAAEALKAASPFMQRFVSATLIGAPMAGNSVEAWTQAVHDTPIEKLMLIPENQELARTMKDELGSYVTPQAIEEAVRSRTVGSGYNVAAATSLATNIGLATLPLHTAQARIVGQVTPRAGAAAEVALSATHQAALGGTMAGAQKTGENVAQRAAGLDTGVFEGVPQAVQQGVTTGLVAGTLLTLPGTRARSKLARSERQRRLLAAEEAAGAEGTVPPPGAPPPGETPPAGAAPGVVPEITPAAAGPASLLPHPSFDAVMKGFVDSIEQDRHLIPGFKKAKLDADGMVAAAQGEAQKKLGNAWGTLDRTQQITLVKALVERAQKARGKKAVPDVDKALEALAAIPKPAAAPASIVEPPLTPEEMQALQGLGLTPEQMAMNDVATSRRILAQQANAPPPEADVPQMAPPVIPTGEAPPVTPPVAPVAPTGEAPGVPPVTAGEAPPVVAPTAEKPIPFKTKQLTAEAKAVQEAQNFFNALGAWDKPLDASNETPRSMPEYKRLLEIYKSGNITNVGELRSALKAVRAEIAGAPPPIDWTTSGEGRTQRIGHLVSLPDKVNATFNAKRIAQAAKTMLVGMGMEPVHVDAMTLSDATNAYKRLTGQGVRPSAEITAAAETARTREPTKGTLKAAPKPKPAPTPTAMGEALTKAGVKPKNVLKKPADVTHTTPEPQAVSGVRGEITALKDVSGRRIPREAQSDLQRIFDLVSKTGKNIKELRDAAAKYVPGDKEAGNRLVEAAGEVFAKRGEAAAEQETAARLSREAPATAPKKGPAGVGVRKWIQDLHAPGGEGVRLPVGVQQGLEALYSRVMANGGTQAEVRTAFEQATGNAAVAEQAATRFDTEFGKSSGTVNSLAKLAEISISEPQAKALNTIANEQGPRWKAADGRSAKEVALDLARSMARSKKGKLAGAKLDVLRQAFEAEASASPKPKAPPQTKQAVGAEGSQKEPNKLQTKQETSKPSPSEVSAVPKNEAPKPTTAEDLADKVHPAVVEAEVLEILGEDAVSNSMIREISDAVTQSRLDQRENGRALAELVNDLVRSEAITKAEGDALKAAGKQVEIVPDEHRAVGTPIDEPTIEGAPKAEPTSETTPEALAYAAQRGEDPTIRASLEAAIAQPREGRAYSLLTQLAANKSLNGTQRWLATKLAKAARVLDINVRNATADENSSWSGWYSRKLNEVTIRKASAVTVLHEMVHGVTSNALHKSGDPKVELLKKRLEELRKRITEYHAENPDAASDQLRWYLNNKAGPLSNIHELLTYGLTEGEFQEYLSLLPEHGRTDSASSVWDGFTRIIKSYFGAMTHNQRTLLDTLMDTSGQLIDIVENNPNLAIEANEAVRDMVAPPLQPRVSDGPIKPGEKNRLDLNRKDSLWRHFAVRYVDSSLGLEQIQQTLRKAGHSISRTMDITRAKILADGTRNENVHSDGYYYSQPVIDYVHNNLGKLAGDLGKSRVETLELVNKFFRSKTQVNRYHNQWLQKVPLHAGADVQRQSILNEVAETPRSDTKEIARLKNELERLVGSRATQSERDYGAAHNAYYDRFAKDLKTLKAQGIHEESMTDLNKLLQRVRDQLQRRAIESGHAAEDDPWIKFYGDEWYVPMKGDPTIDKSLLRGGYEFGDISEDLSLRIMNASYKVAQGTKQPVKNGIERLLADAQVASARAGDKVFNDTLYEFVKKFQKDLGATIRVFNGVPKTGYEQAAGPPVKAKDGIVRKIPGNERTMVLHDGDRHYQIEFPAKSDLLQAIKEMNATNESMLATRLVSKGTQFISKGQTVWKPWWTLATALIRDLLYVPTQLALQHKGSVLESYGVFGKYYKALAANAWGSDTYGGGLLTNVSSAYHMIFTENLRTIDAMADANPNDFIGWYRRMQRAGGGGSVRSMYNEKGLRKKLTGGYDNADGLWQLALPFKYYDQWATGFSGLLEATSRVAGFRAMVESAIEKAGGAVSKAQLAEIERQAAIDAKSVLNFDQKGRYSNGVNGWFAYFKVSTTSLDAARKAFTTPEGKFSVEKLLVAAPLTVGFGLIGMAMTRMMAGDDEEDGKSKLSKIDINTRTQNFITYINGKPHKIPISQGSPQLLIAPGVIMEAMMEGDITPAEAGRAAYEVVVRNIPLRPGGLSSDWSTADVASSYIGAFVPSVFQGPMQLSANQNVFGQQIHRQFTSDEQFASEQGKPATDDTWKDMAKWTRENIGVDAYPETYKFMFQAYLSEVPVDKIAKMQAAGAEAGGGGVGALEAAKELAGVNVHDPEYYYARQLNLTEDALLPAVQEYNKYKNELRARGSNDRAAQVGADSWMARQGELGRQFSAWKALDKAQRAYYKERAGILRDRVLSPERRKMKMKHIDSELRKAIDTAQKSAPA